MASAMMSSPPSSSSSSSQLQCTAMIDDEDESSSSSCNTNGNDNNHDDVKSVVNQSNKFATETIPLAPPDDIVANATIISSATTTATSVPPTSNTTEKNINAGVDDVDETRKLHHIDEDGKAPSMDISMNEATHRTNSTISLSQTSLPQQSVIQSPNDESTPTNTSQQASNLLSLPIDALHNIASFLTPSEFVLQYGLLNHQTQQLCRIIIQRVYMHAYKCLFEMIITYQYYQQYEDCIELAAIYIQNGIPIYPYVFGHAYHTIYWKMNIEIQEQLQQQQNTDAIIANTTTTDVAAVATTTILEDESTTTFQNNNNNNNHNNAIDSFYGQARRDHRTGRNVTYLEEKCNYYVLHPNRNPTNNSNDAETSDEATTAAVTAAATLPSPHRHYRATNVDETSTTTTTTTTTTNASVSPSLLLSSIHRPNINNQKIPVSVHQHLYDRHVIHHEYYIDIQNGTMATPTINLSADFFHPTIIIASHNTGSSSSSNSYRRMTLNKKVTQPLPIPSPIVDDGSNDPMTENSSFITSPQQHVTLSLTDPNNTSLILETNQDNQEISDNVVPFVEIGEDDRQGPVTAPSLLLPNTTTIASSSKVSLCNIDVYSFATMISDTMITKERENIRKHLLSRYMIYQRRLETLLGKGDIYACEECILDIWDEFFPHTSGIHYYDLETPVPRMSHIHQFLTKPCPKAIGTVQCEIERIKITPRGKGVKGRLFPIYEYRLFIRHRPLRSSNSSSNHNNGDAPNTDHDGDDNDNNSSEMNNNNNNNSTTNFVRRDTVLMVAKNRGRKHIEHNITSTTSCNGGIIPFSNTSAKKGSNNYYLYMAQQMDVDDHFRSCNQHLIEDNKYSNSTMEPNGASRHLVTLSDFNNISDIPSNYYDRNMLLGRLQSNFIGTEFQIYIPRIQQLSIPRTDNIGRNSRSHSVMSPPFHSDEEIDYDSGMSSDNNNTVRRSRFSRFRRSALTGNGGTSTTATTTTPHHQHYSTNSDSGSIVTTTTTPTLEYRTMKRTLSSPENLVSYRTTGTMGHHQLQQRHSRINRRAIANDNNTSPSPQRQSPQSSIMLQEEEAGVITYTANLLGSRPRIMDVCVPKVSSDGTIGLEWRQYVESCCTCDDDNNTIDDGCRMLSCFRQIQHRRDNNPPDQPPPAPIVINNNNNHNNNNNNNNNVPVNTNPTEAEGDINNNGGVDNDFGLLALQNRPPWWNAELGSFVLNFGGRVSVASVKNFQLCIRTNPDSILLQFGRIHGGRHSFTMDYSHPLTTVQAFSIAISSLQSKISFG